MPTTVTETIGTGGEDYSSIGSWEGATDNDLVTDDEVRIGEMSNESFDENVICNGSTTDATRYRVLRAASGAEYDPATDTGAAIAWSATTNATYALTVSDDYHVMGGYGRGFLVRRTNTDAGFGIGSGGAQTNNSFIGLVSDAPNNTAYAHVRLVEIDADNCLLANCISIGTGQAGSTQQRVGFEVNGDNNQLYNCIAYNISRAAGGWGFDINSATGNDVRNCIALDCDTDFASSAATEDYNISSDATASGSNSHTNETTATDVLTDPDNGDFTLASGSVGIDGGVDLSATFTEDFNGDSHGSNGTWDIGAFDYVVAAGISTSPVPLDLQTQDLGIAQTLNPASVSLNLAAQDPGIAQTLNPSAVSLGLATQNPGIAQTLNPSAVPLDLATQDPTIGLSLNPSSVPLDLATQDPGIAQTLNPSAVPLDLVAMAVQDTGRDISVDAVPLNLVGLSTGVALAPPALERGSVSGTDSADLLVDTISWNHTVANNTNRVLIVAVAQQRGSWGGSGPNVLFNGVGMTAQESIAIQGDGNGTSMAIYWLAAPSVGTHLVSVTFDVADSSIGMSVDYWNAEQVSPLSDLMIGQSLNNPSEVSATVASRVGDEAIDFLARRRNDDISQADPGQTVIRQDTTTRLTVAQNVSLQVSVEPGDASVFMRWDWSGTTNRDSSYYVTAVRHLEASNHIISGGLPVSLDLVATDVAVDPGVTGVAVPLDLAILSPSISFELVPEPVALDLVAFSVTANRDISVATVPLDIAVQSVDVDRVIAPSGTVPLGLVALSSDVDRAMQAAVAALDLVVTAAPGITFQLNPATVPLDLVTPDHSVDITLNPATVPLDLVTPAPLLGTSLTPPAVALDLVAQANASVEAPLTPNPVALDLVVLALSRGVGYDVDVAVLTLAATDIHVATTPSETLAPAPVPLNLAVLVVQVPGEVIVSAVPLGLATQAVETFRDISPTAVPLDLPVPTPSVDIGLTPDSIPLDLAALDVSVVRDVSPSPVPLDLVSQTPDLVFGLIPNPVPLDIPTLAPLVDAPRVVLPSAVSLDLSVPVQSLSVTELLGFYGATSRTVRQRIRTQWAGPRSIPVQYDNLPFVKPNGVLWASASVAYTFQPEVIGISEAEIDMLGFGEIEIAIYSPIANGEQDALDEADVLVEAFENSVSMGVHFQSPTVERRGIRGANWEVVFRCPFWANDTAPNPEAVSPELVGDRDDVGVALRSRFRTSVEVPQSVPVQYESLPFTPPNDSEWIRVSVVEGGSFIAEHGDTHRSAGVLQAEINVPLGTGEARAFELVDAVDDALRNVNLQGIELLEPNVSRGRQSGSEWRRVMTCPFVADLLT